MTASPTPINPGEITLGKQLSHAAVADVYLATWKGRSVVVKQLRLTGEAPLSRDECLREATLLHQSSHPNVVGLHGISDKSTEYWLVLEHVAQGALNQLLKSPQELPWDMRLDMAKDMASGLDYLHTKNILHRDIKSPNILIDEKHRAKLADFGLAKPEDQMRTQTNAQGTWLWCAPEVLDARKFSKYSDVYALGMVYWELSSRETPFKQLLISGIFKAVSEGKRPEMPKNTPAPFAMLIRNCWQQQADTRPLCPEILECLHLMIRPKEPASSLSATSAAAATSASVLSASSSTPSLAASPSQVTKTVADLTGLLTSLTSNTQVKADKELMELFSDKLAELIVREETDPIKTTDNTLCRAIQHLIDNEGKINEAVKRALLKIDPPKVSPSFPIPIASSSSSKLAAPTLPPIAFGATAWSTYFGDVGTEPPLPPNIHDILNASCLYWPDKKVSETHMLVLIPEKVNGHPLTLKTLGELVKTPKKGNVGKYDYYYPHTYGDTPAPASHWILMTRDVIPGSRSKSFTAQKALLKEGDTIPKLLDATAAIFMQNASGGKHGYVRDPLTYTRCEEPYNEWQMAVGGLAPLLAPGGGLSVRSNHGDGGIVGVAAARKF